MQKCLKIVLGRQHAQNVILDTNGFYKFEKCWIVKVPSLKHLRCKFVLYDFFPSMHKCSGHVALIMIILFLKKVFKIK